MPQTGTSTTGNDTIKGTGSESYAIAGLEGDDIIQTESGNDALYGNQGRDTISAGTGKDTVTGGQDADYLLGNAGNDLIYGNMGNDTVYGGQDNDTVFAGQGDDLIFGGEGDDIIHGNLGNDTVGGGAGYDVMALSGARSDYTFARTADGSIIITSGPDGIDYAVNIEAFMFGNGDTYSVNDLFPPAPPPPTPAPTYSNTASLDVSIPTSDRNGSGNIPYGDGTTPPAGVYGVSNAERNFHVNIAERYRTVADPLNTTTASFDGTTLTLNFTAAAGTQSTANGSLSNNPNRAATNDDYIIGTDNGTTIADLLSGGVRLERLYDTDETNGVNHIVLEARLDTVNGNIDWYLAGTNTLVVGDDGGDANTSANSFNRLFIPGFTAADLVAGANFDDYFRAYDPSGNMIFQIHSDITLV